jgi:hypothetical protein
MIDFRFLLRCQPGDRSDLSFENGYFTRAATRTSTRTISSQTSPNQPAHSTHHVRHVVVLQIAKHKPLASVTLVRRFSGEVLSGLGPVGAAWISR